MHGDHFAGGELVDQARPAVCHVIKRAALVAGDHKDQRCHRLAPQKNERKVPRVEIQNVGGGASKRKFDAGVGGGVEEQPQPPKTKGKYLRKVGDVNENEFVFPLRFSVPGRALEEKRGLWSKSTTHDRNFAEAHPTNIPGEKCIRNRNQTNAHNKQETKSQQASKGNHNTSQHTQTPNCNRPSTNQMQTHSQQTAEPRIAAVDHRVVFRGEVVVKDAVNQGTAPSIPDSSKGCDQHKHHAVFLTHARKHTYIRQTIAKTLT